MVLFGFPDLMAGPTWLPGDYPFAGSFDPAFLISLGVFAFVLLALTKRWMHETAATPAGIVILWLATNIGGSFAPALRHLTFHRSIGFVDWNAAFTVLRIITVFQAGPRFGLPRRTILFDPAGHQPRPEDRLAGDWR